MVKRGSAESKSKTSFWSILIIILVVILIAFAFLKNSTATVEEAYISYKKDFDKMQSFEEYLDVVNEHGTQNYINNVSVYVESFKILPSDLNMVLLTAHKGLSIPANEVKNLPMEKIISEDSAILSINSLDGTKIGKITLLKVKGEWKVDSDTWSKGNQ